MDFDELAKAMNSGGVGDLLGEVSWMVQQVLKGSQGELQTQKPASKGEPMQSSGRLILLATPEINNKLTGTLA